MTGINHKQAQCYLRAAADGLLRENQRALLDTHLRECDSCRTEADELNALETRLKKNFQARWNTNDGPSTNVMTTIQSRSRRIIMTNRINTALKTAAGLAALLALIVLLNSLLGRFRSSAVPASATQTNTTTQSTQAEGLIAFVSGKDYSNGEIYTMKADGSDLTNLTNNPATDDSPAWSPDGKQIAFESDRSGGRDIYLMNADGSNVRQLTDSSTFNSRFTWSPDGAKIVYLSSENGLFDISNLIIMDADGSNKIALTPEPGKYTFLSWSPDGQNIVYQVSDLGGNKATRVMVVNINGTTVSDGPFFEGDSGRQYQRVYWETQNQFVTISSNFEQTPPWGKWNITRFFTDGDSNKYNGSNPILITSDTPILAIFENTYVTLDQGSLVWLSYKGAPIPYSPWKMDSACKPSDKQVTFDLQKSPDDKHGFISVNCGDGTSTLYLVDAVGDKVQQLGRIFEGIPIPFAVWSPDGKHVLLAISDQQKAEYYRLDLEEMLINPSAQPVQLPADGVNKYGAVWQPQLSNDIVVNSPTNAPTELPQPFQFGVPVENEQNALIAAESSLRTAYSYVEPLTVVKVEQESYGEYAKQLGKPLNQPADLKVWLIVYFNNKWQSILFTPSNYSNSSSQFRGCMYMAINANDGSLVEMGWPLPKGITPECDK